MSKIERIEPKKSFLAFLFDGLQAVDNGLGDRSKYIGASDIGSCLKKAYLSKTIKTPDRSLDEMLVLERGHVVEGIIEKALIARRINYKAQVEVSLKNGTTPIAAHIDFVAEDSREAVVIECKSVSSAIDEPYENWILQAQLQIGLLRSQSSKSVNRGIIVALNVNDGWAMEFPVQFNELLYVQALARAKQLWDCVEQGVEPEGECGHLCGYCPFKSQCSSLRSGATELPADLSQKVNRLVTLDKREKEAKAIKRELKSYLEAVGIKKATAGANAVSLVLCKGKSSVDLKKLAELVGEDVIAECISEGDSYSYARVF
jgi:CRISPR-associated exonuclease Cas4